MDFKRVMPLASIKEFIECYWILDDKDPAPKQQKIIPDGFPEIIFHYGDPYRILIKQDWELQSDFLLAGQITKFFYLENTGTTGTFGIKFKPTAITHLFNLLMKEYVDKVVSLNNTDNPELKKIKTIVSPGQDFKQIIIQLNSFFEKLIAEKKFIATGVDNSVDLIFEKHGMVTIPELCAVAFLGERQLLNQFRRYIGLSPKLYARVIRLNYIFQLVRENKEKWSSLAYEAAFFDQAHFIKDFKKFTGENPGKYSFEEKNMANFFLMPNFQKNS
jgi:AraC-like DNA-binding protein